MPEHSGAFWREEFMERRVYKQFVLIQLFLNRLLNIRLPAST
jgi:hypothetical protein